MSEANDDPDAVSHCPNCGGDYRAGFTTCSDCGVELGTGAAEDESPARTHDLDFYQEHDMRNFGRTFDMFDREEGKPVAITTESEPDLGLLIGRLESEGIGARPGPMDMTGFPWGAFGVVGPLGAVVGRAERWVVLVREPNVARAKEIYDTFAKIQGDVDRGIEPEPSSHDDDHPNREDAWIEANRRVWHTPTEK